MSSEREKTWTSRIQLFLLICTLAGGVGFYYQKEEKNEQRMWSTPEIRVIGEDHIVNRPDDVESYLSAKKIDSLLEHGIMTDSIKNYMDSVNLDMSRRNADQIYQMKELLQEYIQLHDQ